MEKAIEIAKSSNQIDVPVGAIIIRISEQRIIAKAHNCSKNPIAHAEILAINQIDEKYLDDCEIFVTLQPCPMCMHAIRLKRIKRVIFGAYRDMFENHHDLSNTNPFPQIIGGICEESTRKMMKIFFQSLR